MRTIAPFIPYPYCTDITASLEKRGLLYFFARLTRCFFQFFAGFPRCRKPINSDVRVALLFAWPGTYFMGTVTKNIIFNPSRGRKGIIYPCRVALSRWSKIIISITRSSAPAQIIIIDAVISVQHFACCYCQACVYCLHECLVCATMSVRRQRPCMHACTARSVPIIACKFYVSPVWSLRAAGLALDQPFWLDVWYFSLWHSKPNLKLLLKGGLLQHVISS